MKVTFVSNYINHHQIPFSNAMYAKLGDDYRFVQMEPMEEERIRMGWSADVAALGYVVLGYENPGEAEKLIMESDIIIWGGTEDETLLKPRLDAGKPVIRYSERLYKTGQWKAISPRGLRKKYHDHTKYRKSPVYLLCSGAYVSSDFHIVRAYPGKMLKWGYFPETKHYDVDKLMSEKCGRTEGGKKELLWAARFIDWKHPEMVVELAKLLKAQRADFHITMIGGGELEPVIRKEIEEKNLQDVLTLAGYKAPEEVRAYMEKADIYLITSDRQEGWGAVANEAMNSGCAVVSNHMIGAAPYLIKQGENGFMYSDGNLKELSEKVSLLLGDDGLRDKIGRAAYETITTEWNAEVAADRVMSIAEDIVQGKPVGYKWTSGPGSEAVILRESKIWKDL